jgi:hypothetical protein
MRKNAGSRSGSTTLILSILFSVRCKQFRSGYNWIQATKKAGLSIRLAKYPYYGFHIHMSILSRVVDY